MVLGASGTEDDGEASGGSGSNTSNTNSKKHYHSKKHFHHQRRQRLPPKKLEVGIPLAVQDLEEIMANSGGKKIKSKNHQHHRVVWYFLHVETFFARALKIQKNLILYSKILLRNSK